MRLRFDRRALTRALLPIRAFAQACAMLGLVLTAGAAAANDAPLQTAAIAPDALLQDTLPSVRAPFGLARSALAPAPSAAMTAKWRALQPVIALETRIIALCRAEPATCTPAAAQFLSIVEAARSESGRARIGLINRAVNLAIRPARDSAQFLVPDMWMTPLMTLSRGAGDCEDYAIAKYVALRAAGVDAADLRLMIVHDRSNGEDHAITAARIDGEWLILDNRRLTLLTDTQAANLTPLIALGDEAPVLVRDAGLDARIMPQALAA